MDEKKDIFDSLFDRDGALIFRTVADHIKLILFWSMVSIVMVYTIEHLKPDHLKVLELKQEKN